jgi:hypothetical protein
MVLVTFAETKVTRVRADARIKIKTSRSDTKASHAVTKNSILQSVLG